MGGGESDLFGQGNSVKDSKDRLAKINSLDDFLNEPKKLGGIKPDVLYNYLVEKGYSLSPLMDGDLRGIEFKDGGGFKVNWGGDRILQYHPRGRHHGYQPYYKLASGKTGRRRYDMEGNELKDK